MGSNNLNQVKKYTHHYIAVSEAVKRNLVCNHGIPDTMIDVVHGFIPSETFTYRTDKEKKLRKSLNIPDDSFIVGSSGYETWRKGKDLFVQLALNTVSKYKDRDVHFVWIGGQSDGNDFYRIKHDVQLANLSDKVHFVAHVANPLDYFQEFDVFAMLSREDPFPLVNLELAALGKPIVCFDNAGGTPEFVGNDAGYVVPYLDISAMADRIITLAGDVNLRERLGANGLHKVREHHDIQVGAPKIVKIIERFLHSTS
jgi:glycosyltransferase involved in cell wall biosynthesis